MAAHSADVVLYWEFEARLKSRETTQNSPDRGNEKTDWTLHAFALS